VTKKEHYALKIQNFHKLSFGISSLSWSNQEQFS